MIGSAFAGTLWTTTGENKNNDDKNNDDKNTDDKNTDDKNTDDGRARSQWRVTRQSSPNGRITS
jgi:hypothetical protein